MTFPNIHMVVVVFHAEDLGQQFVSNLWALPFCQCGCFACIGWPSCISTKPSSSLDASSFGSLSVKYLSTGALETASLIFSKASCSSWVQYYSAFLCVRWHSGSHSSDRSCRNLDRYFTSPMNLCQSLHLNYCFDFFRICFKPILCHYMPGEWHFTALQLNFSLFSLIFLALQRSRRFFRFWSCSRSGFSSVSPCPMMSRST